MSEIHWKCSCDPRITSKLVYRTGEFAEFVKQLQKAIASMTTSIEAYKYACNKVCILT